MKSGQRFAFGARRQGGVATLIVVMVLFFIVSMVAAYTNRNLIFEQRTSANQYRSTQALEAAEAGVEWALAMLNFERINALCEKGDPTDSNYRDRYLVPDIVSGNLTPIPKTGGGVDRDRSQSCVHDGTGWKCSCPTDADPTPAVPTVDGVYPAFRVRLVAPVPHRPGVIVIHSVGCTRFDNACLDFDVAGVANEGRAAVRVLAALAGNAVSPPSAAIMARGSVGLTGASPGAAYNTAEEGSGRTVHAMGSVSGINSFSKPGTPGDASVDDNDPGLLLPSQGGFSSEERFFASVFNMTSGTFLFQPAVIQLSCPGGTCDAERVRTAVALYPGRPLWVHGHVLVDSAPAIGDVDRPALLIINGNLTFDASAGPVGPVYGVAYIRQDWTTNGSGEVVGAVVAQGNISGSGAPTVVRNAAVLSALRHTVGSFVRVPGGWRDFR